MLVLIVRLLVYILILINLWVYLSYFCYYLLYLSINYIKASLLKWFLLGISLLILLFIPWYFNILKWEWSLPWWLPYFYFQIFLVALVEELYFRGYLQQRLT